MEVVFPCLLDSPPVIGANRRMGSALGSGKLIYFQMCRATSIKILVQIHRHAFHPSGGGPRILMHRDGGEGVKEKSSIAKTNEQTENTTKNKTFPKPSWEEDYETNKNNKQTLERSKTK